MSAAKVATRPSLIIVALTIGLVLSALSLTLFSTQQASRSRLIVSTTTSLYETGLLDILKSNFEREHPNLNVSFISQGTGLAIQTAIRGDADLILVHNPEMELTFLQRGYGVNRKIIAYNFFAIVGPRNDPANIRGLTPIEAFKKIKAMGESGRAIWVSRGDDSGTHARERQIWKSAGLEPATLTKQAWYLEAGAGMTATLRIADEKSGYTLTDLGTYLMSRKSMNVKLDLIVQAGKEMLNVYSAIACDPRNKNLTAINFEGSMKFIRFLVSKQGQELIASFGKDLYGQALFKSYTQLLETKSDLEAIRWIEETAYFEGSECPSRFRFEEGDLYLVTEQIDCLSALWRRCNNS
jgi:tungstate transport system substrate-binding protein